MSLLRDFHIPTHSHQHRISHELFDATSDVFLWIKKGKKFHKKTTWIKKTKSTLNFVLLTSIIFTALILIANWGAYADFAKAHLAPDVLQKEQDTLEKGLQNIEAHNQNTENTAREKRLQSILKRQLEKKQVTTLPLGIDYFNQDIQALSASVEITPYEDRIVIPKIGKNIPLLNVENRDAGNSEEWHKIFMEELANGIIKYPGSADPGTEGNSFIFGHSSNYPWAKGDYNDVFALLNELVPGDEIIAYYKQQKFVYRVKEKRVVKPGQVSSLGDATHDKQLTLMTCWPLGTTLNRLLIITELDNQT